MHVIVLSCTHLQKNMYVSMNFLYLVHTFDPTGKGSIETQPMAITPFFSYAFKWSHITCNLTHKHGNTPYSLE